MKTKPFSELRKRMTPERRAESYLRAQFVLLHTAVNSVLLLRKKRLTKG